MKLRHRYRQLLAPLVIGPLLLVASCGGNDDEPASEPVTRTDTGSAAPDASDDDSGDDQDSDDDQQVACNLLSNEEIADATGFEVVAAEGNTFGLPMCEWELSVPESTGPRGLPALQIVLLSESDYRSRVEPFLDSLADIDGPADEMKLHFVGGGDTGIPAMVNLFVLDGDQGFEIQPGFEIWHDEAAATSALVDLTVKIIDRI